MIVFLLSLIIVIAYIALDCSLEVHKYHIKTNVINSTLKFAIITDLHSSSYGKNMEQLISVVTAENPDAVLMVGDIFDCRQDNKNSWTFTTEIAQKYPCYYVTGNHEIASAELEDTLQRLRLLGVKVLTGTSDILRVNNKSVRICGVDDALSPDFMSQLHDLASEYTNAEYHILLSHRPEYISTYADSGVDLIISGHAHGGQWRIPWFIDNGVYAPNQGVFPEYTGGLYKFNNTQLLVSRGLDKQSVELPRIFNRPEIVILTLS